MCWQCHMPLLHLSFVWALLSTQRYCHMFTSFCAHYPNHISPLIWCHDQMHENKPDKYHSLSLLQIHFHLKQRPDCLFHPKTQTKDSQPFGMSNFFSILRFYSLQSRVNNGDSIKRSAHWLQMQTMETFYKGFQGLIVKLNTSGVLRQCCADVLFSRTQPHTSAEDLIPSVFVDILVLFFPIIPGLT